MNEELGASQVVTTCCIVGGGPAGVMLGLLLARAGVAVTVLEKHRDFNRDFRGDTVHPATLEIMYELGLLPSLLRLPHQRIDRVSGVLGGTEYPIADFSRLPVHAPFIALMPQWDLLNFLAAEGRQYPTFDLRMEHRVTQLIEQHGRVVGARAESSQGTVEVRAALTVGCDGRHAVTTDCAHLEQIERGAPIDVLWFRISRRPDDPEEGLGYLNCGRMLILINRGDYFQCGYIIRKGSFADVIQPAGLAQLRRDLGELAPILAQPGTDGHSRVDELTAWDQLKLLTVQVNRLRRWHAPGLLCIGDAAHAMSPVGGIGINLAIQDAVATANLLAAPLRHLTHNRTIPEATLARVQRRRELATRLTQFLQIQVHRFLNRYLGNPRPLRPSWILRLVSRLPLLRRLPGRLIGLGLRPEHVAPLRPLRASAAAPQLQA